MRKRPTIQHIIRAVGAVLLLLPPLLLTDNVQAESYYRWQDSKGVYQYTDERPPAEIVAEQVTIEGGHGFYRVAKVYDGDTVRLESGEKVRLIGINTPEVAHRNRPSEPGGEVASDYLRKLIEGELVRLEYGKERRDKYQRLLAHLFTEEGENINALMLSEGYAHAVIKLPNIRLLQHYFDAERGARDAGRGIWRLPHFKVHKIGEAAAFRNTFRRLQGVINRVEEKRSAWLLYFDSMGDAGVKALIRKEHLDSFIRDGRHPDRLAGKRVTIRGWVHFSRGKPLIRLRDSKSIERIE